MLKVQSVGQLSCLVKWLLAVVCGLLLSCRAAPHPVDRDEISGLVDTIAVAKQAGADYQALWQASLRRDRAALRRLFALTTEAGFDAASSQGHAAVLGQLLRRLGDDVFGGALQTSAFSIKKAVWDSLSYDFGCEAAVLSEAQLQAWYPRSFAGQLLPDQQLSLHGQVGMVAHVHQGNGVRSQALILTLAQPHYFVGDEFCAAAAVTELHVLVQDAQQLLKLSKQQHHQLSLHGEVFGGHTAHHARPVVLRLSHFVLRQ